MGRALSSKSPNKQKAKSQRALKCNTNIPRDPGPETVDLKSPIQPLQRNWAAELMGTHLVDCNTSGGRVHTRTLSNCDVIGIAEFLPEAHTGLYFGSCSGWCEACNSFTPLLKAAYKQANRVKPTTFEVWQDGCTVVDLQVVYVSHDRNQSEWTDSVGSMPWKALLWGHEERRLAMREAFHVSVIPTLVMLKPNGSPLISVNVDGAKHLRADPILSEFPWTDMCWSSLIGNSFVVPITQGDGTGTTRVNRTALGEGVLLLVIASLSDAAMVTTGLGWVGEGVQVEGAVKACEWLKEHPVMRNRCNHFEVNCSVEGESCCQALFVSTDQSFDHFTRIFEKVPWPAVPFEKTVKRRAELARRFGVTNKGKVVVVSQEGKILNKDAFAAITAPNNFERFPWEETEENQTVASCAIQCLDQVSNKCVIS